jgi:hypothetical protein
MPIYRPTPTASQAPTFDSTQLEQNAAALRSKLDSTIEEVDSLHETVVSEKLRLNELITDVGARIGEIVIFSSAVNTWPLTALAGETIYYLSNSGMPQTLKLSGLPTILTEIWVNGKKVALGTTLDIPLCQYAEASIVGTILNIVCNYSLGANIRWAKETTLGGALTALYPGWPNTREWMRRASGKLMILLPAMTPNEMISAANTTPLVNYLGANGVTIAAEPAIDSVYFTGLGKPQEIIVGNALDRLLPAGLYLVSVTFGTRIELIQLSANSDSGWLVNNQWFQSSNAANERYTRDLSSAFSAFSKVEVEYELNGTNYIFSHTDFTEGVGPNNNFVFMDTPAWNPTGGVTRQAADVYGGRLIMALSANRKAITLAMVDQAKTDGQAGYWLRFRNVKLNGIPADLMLSKQDLTPYALKTDIPALPDLTSYALKSELPRETYTTANAGMWVTHGSIQLQIPSSGSRSLQIRSASGSISIGWITWTAWNSAQNNTASVTASSTQYLNSTWNFTNANDLQFAFIKDNTNNRTYRVTMQIGAAYNNNHFVISG